MSSGPARPGGGVSFKSRLVRSAATRCWFSCSASVRVAYESQNVTGSGIRWRREVRGVRVARLPRPVRRLVVHHQEERLVARTVLDELERQVGDDVGRIAAGVGLLPGRRVEHGIAVRALAGQDLPAIEPDGIAAEVPLADHPGVVAALLQQPRDRHARTVEPIEHRHAVEVRVLAGQNRGAARRADRVGGKDARQQRALARQPIEVRRLVDARPVRADRVRRVVVGHDEDDVGTAHRLCLHYRMRGHAASDKATANTGSFILRAFYRSRFTAGLDRPLHVRASC